MKKGDYSAWTSASPSLLNKAFRLSLLEGAVFDENLKTGEDVLFTIQLMAKISKGSYLPDKLYYHRGRKSSLVNTHNTDIGHLELYAKLLAAGGTGEMTSQFVSRFVRAAYNLAIQGIGINRQNVMAVISSVPDNFISHNTRKHLARINNPTILIAQRIVRNIRMFFSGIMRGRGDDLFE